MSHTIPFAEKTIRPLCVKGNEGAESPVEFDICAVGGAAKARLRSMILATSGLAEMGEWTDAVQKQVIASFENGAGVFIEGITEIRGLKVAAALALRVGILSEIPKGLDRKSDIPISTGFHFSKICGFWPILSFEIAMAIAEISGQAEIDPRFFGWLGTSLGRPAAPSGIAGPAAATRAANETAGSKTRRGRNLRST